ncbi:LysR substrate-binding domain-containing protein [Pseudomonas sp. Pc102]|uniref:LysR substrate-binding domain-containing protein n=1 Tax=Pseudomonas sp. Pc102 TaxID=2678261 RepID=UPI0032AE9662
MPVSARSISRTSTLPPSVPGRTAGARARHHAPDAQGARPARAAEIAAGGRDRPGRSARSAIERNHPDTAPSDGGLSGAGRDQPATTCPRRNRTGDRPGDPALARRRSRAHCADRRRDRHRDLVFPDESEDLHREELLHEEYVIALRSGHPAIAGFDLDSWLAYPHIITSGRGEARTPLDTELARLGRNRRVGLVVPSFGMVPDLLRGSDMIAMLPSRIVPADGDLAVLPPPIPVSGFPLHLAWHRRREKDAALRHVARLLAGLLE